MPTYKFFYDETEHSRKINLDTVEAKNYYDNFVTMIVGWEEGADDILQRYSAWEEKYSDRKNRNGEIKSTALQQKRFKNGFASLNKQNVQFLDDFLSIFDESIHIFFSVGSKIEYLVLQIFRGYHNDLLIDADLMKYSITKALVMYHPKELLESIYESPENFLVQLRKFFRDRIERNKSNTALKQDETAAFEEILAILEDINDIAELRWDYHMPFSGFKKYLQEKEIQDYSLLIDKEGEDGEESRTQKAAKRVGIKNVSEDNSIYHAGLRIADMLAGIITKLMKALSNSLCYHSLDEGTTKKILDTSWFKMNDEQLSLYKKLYQIIFVWQPAWYKSYAGIYADDLVTLNALLNYMNHFESARQIQDEIDMQGEYFNAFCCKELSDYFKWRQLKLPLEPTAIIDNEFYVNQRGAKIYLNSRFQSKLPLNGGKQSFHVLAVGVDHNKVPLVTVLEEGQSVCYRLPDGLTDWAITLVGMAARGQELLPAEVIFTYHKGKYYADIL